METTAGQLSVFELLSDLPPVAPLKYPSSGPDSIGARESGSAGQIVESASPASAVQSAAIRRLMRFNEPLPSFWMWMREVEAVLRGRSRG